MVHPMRCVTWRASPANGLRYTLEFFADALGPNVNQALEPLMDLQETLGKLQDAVVARDHIRTLGLTDDAGAQEYLAALDSGARSVARQLPTPVGKS
jgi:CHAD domain-containing protein